jgi:hypothetical protein
MLTEHALPKCPRLLTSALSRGLQYNEEPESNFQYPVITKMSRTLPSRIGALPSRFRPPAGRNAPTHTSLANRKVTSEFLSCTVQLIYAVRSVTCAANFVESTLFGVRFIGAVGCADTSDSKTTLLVLHCIILTDKQRRQ